MFTKKSSFGSFALTFIGGAVAGAALALLYAPMTGRKMQKKVADATERMKDVVEGSVDNMQSLLRKVVNA
jgi:gas vesicle protein